MKSKQVQIEINEAKKLLLSTGEPCRTFWEVCVFIIWRRHAQGGLALSSWNGAASGGAVCHVGISVNGILYYVCARVISGAIPCRIQAVKGACFPHLWHTSSCFSSGEGQVSLTLTRCNWISGSSSPVVRDICLRGFQTQNARQRSYTG